MSEQDMVSMIQKTTADAVLAAMSMNGKSLQESISKIPTKISSKPKASEIAATPEDLGPGSVSWRSKKASKARPAREDHRRPETLLKVAQTTDNKAITVGVTDRGTFGVQVGDGSIVYHMRATWALLAKIAPIAYQAMADHYEA